MKRKKLIISVILLVWICCVAALIFRGCQSSARLNGYFITDESGQRTWCELPTIRYGSPKRTVISDNWHLSDVSLTETELAALLNSWPHGMQHLGWEDYELKATAVVLPEHTDSGETVFRFSYLEVEGYRGPKEEGYRPVFTLRISPDHIPSGIFSANHKGKTTYIQGVSVDGCRQDGRHWVSLRTENVGVHFEIGDDLLAARNLTARVVRYAIVEDGFSFDALQTLMERVNEK